MVYTNTYVLVTRHYSVYVCVLVLTSLSALLLMDLLKCPDPVKWSSIQGNSLYGVTYMSILRYWRGGGGREGGREGEREGGG